jgi:hypothetical protein
MKDEDLKIEEIETSHTLTGTRGESHQGRVERRRMNEF